MRKRLSVSISYGLSDPGSEHLVHRLGKAARPPRNPPLEIPRQLFERAPDDRAPAEGRASAMGPRSTLLEESPVAPLSGSRWPCPACATLRPRLRGLILSLLRHPEPTSTGAPGLAPHPRTNPFWANSGCCGCCSRCSISMMPSAGTAFVIQFWSIGPDSCAIRQGRTRIWRRVPGGHATGVDSGHRLRTETRGALTKDLRPPTRLAPGPRGASRVPPGTGRPAGSAVCGCAMVPGGSRRCLRQWTKFGPRK
jgi:hypothetical protein